MAFKFLRPFTTHARLFRSDASTSFLSQLPLTSTPTTTPPTTEISQIKTTNNLTTKQSGKSRTQPKNRPRIILPPINENDLIEKFVRGSGPGGQAVQKTSNAVSLIHIPTGTHIHCHETRSRETNRTLARRRMQEQLDLLENQGTSKKALEWNRLREMKESRKRKAKRKIEAKMLEVEERAVNRGEGRRLEKENLIKKSQVGEGEAGEGEEVVVDGETRKLKNWEKKRLALAVTSSEDKEGIQLEGRGEKKQAEVLVKGETRKVSSSHWRKVLHDLLDGS